MNPNDFARVTPRLIVGIGVLAFGLLWTADNLNMVEAEYLLEWWPAIIVLAGLARLTMPNRNRIGSVVIIVVGTVLLLDSIDVANIDLGDLIPLGIAAIGGKIAWDALHRREPGYPGSGDPSSVLSASAIMAGVKRQSDASTFRGGDTNAIMGAVELDLRGAKIADGEEAVIDAFALWGGVEIRVPDTWRVRGNVLPLLGGFDDKTRPVGEHGPVLTVRGTAIMGGIEVKN